MSNFTKSIVYSGVVLAVGLIAIFAIRSNMENQGTLATLEPAAGEYNAISSETNAVGTAEPGYTQTTATTSTETAPGTSTDTSGDTASTTGTTTTTDQMMQGTPAEAAVEAAHDAQDAATDATEAATDAQKAAEDAQKAAETAKDAASESTGSTGGTFEPSTAAEPAAGEPSDNNDSTTGTAE